MSRPIESAVGGVFSVALWMLVIGIAADADAAEWTIKGQVLDGNGDPARDFEVATLWSANGQQWNDDGTFPNLDTKEAISEWWNDEGKLAPHPLRRARAYDEGRFEFDSKSIGATSGCVVFAANKQRTLGGCVYVTTDAKQPLAIVLGPLVRVRGEIRCAGAIPEWTYASVFPGNIIKPPD